MLKHNIDMMDMFHMKLLKPRTARDYYDYKTKVLHRAAHSIGCDVSDLDHTVIIDYWEKGMSQFEAARELETQLQEEAWENRG